MSDRRILSNQSIPTNSASDQQFQILSNKCSEEPRQPHQRFLHMTSLRVLLVESDDSTYVVTALLRNCRYEVVEVSNGLQAWKILEDITTRINLVLTEPSPVPFPVRTLRRHCSSMQNYEPQNTEEYTSNHGSGGESGAQMPKYLKSKKS
ncbi:hypothetical protein Nepgr_024950 [Nepenthes gracilis]|uniref:Response regulatory domain-containing protein n=1 Tax=Nepenthes gracilis TaxID=150966 RepID=A0AAD3T5I0_NEPGR|nr:hypothetical protein Nepgr_024950 [Nepenthes gracilis]